MCPLVWSVLLYEGILIMYRHYGRRLVHLSYRIAHHLFKSEHEKPNCNMLERFRNSNVFAILAPPELYAYGNAIFEAREHMIYFHPAVGKVPWSGSSPPPSVPSSPSSFLVRCARTGFAFSIMERDVRPRCSPSVAAYKVSSPSSCSTGE